MQHTKGNRRKATGDRPKARSKIKRALSDDVALTAAGLRQAMGTFGALMGSLIAGLAYNFSGRNYALTFSLSAVPALGALILVTSVSQSCPYVLHDSVASQKPLQEAMRPPSLCRQCMPVEHAWCRLWEWSETEVD